MQPPKPGPGPLRATVILDYQNVHMTAHDIFAPADPLHRAVIDPMLFARQAIAERNERQREGHREAACRRVLVFRGLPHTDYDPEQNAICLAQAQAWEASGAIVDLRDLKYDFQRGADGKPIRDIHGRKTPLGRGREKGIDVLCALACVREAGRTDTDIVVLATRDTDLVPALDEVHDLSVNDPARYAKIETVSWYERDARMFGQLSPSGGRRIWNTNLGAARFRASLDHRDYRH